METSLQCEKFAGRCSLDEPCSESGTGTILLSDLRGNFLAYPSLPRQRRRDHGRSSIGHDLNLLDLGLVELGCGDVMVAERTPTVYFPTRVRVEVRINGRG